MSNYFDTGTFCDGSYRSETASEREMRRDFEAQAESFASDMTPERAAEFKKFIRDMTEEVRSAAYSRGTDAGYEQATY